RGLPDDKERIERMKNWFLSLKGAITLSGLAFLSFLGRAANPVLTSDPAFDLRRDSVAAW
ncbi:MAG TPA: hypothetical protein VLY63_25770, partial [Anaerolineae bacterium]|nr:hypothetical protein [Anaerolineae bacterium]